MLPGGVTCTTTSEITAQKSQRISYAPFCKSHGRGNPPSHEQPSTPAPQRHCLRLRQSASPRQVTHYIIIIIIIIISCLWQKAKLNIQHNSNNVHAFVCLCAWKGIWKGDCRPLHNLSISIHIQYYPYSTCKPLWLCDVWLMFIKLNNKILNLGATNLAMRVCVHVSELQSQLKETASTTGDIGTLVPLLLFYRYDQFPLNFEACSRLSIMLYEDISRNTTVVDQDHCEIQLACLNQHTCSTGELRFQADPVPRQLLTR